MSNKSAARTLLNVGFWIANIEIILIVLLAFILSFTDDTYGLLAFLPIVLIILAPIIICQIITKIGINKVPNSTGWCIFFIIYGTFFLFMLIGLLYLIGGILGIIENNNQQKAKD